MRDHWENVFDKSSHLVEEAIDRAGKLADENVVAQVIVICTSAIIGQMACMMADQNLRRDH